VGIVFVLAFGGFVRYGEAVYCIMNIKVASLIILGKYSFGGSH